MPTLHIAQNTIAKQSTAPASTLPKSAIANLPPGNREITAYKPAGNNHWSIAFKSAIASLDGSKTYQSWLVYADSVEISDDAGKVVPIAPKGSKVLGFVEQPDGSTCQSAAIARVIGSTDVMAVRRSLLQMGEPGSPAVMGEYLKPRVQEYKFNGSASLQDAIDGLNQGYELICHTYLTSGHVIGLSGFNAGTKIFNGEDPWCLFNTDRWAYDYNKSGDNAPYSDRLIYAVAIAGQSNWDAMELYRAGKVSYSDRGMWLHLIKN